MISVKYIRILQIAQKLTNSLQVGGIGGMRFPTIDKYQYFPYNKLQLYCKMTQLDVLQIPQPELY